jgi:hypothetical protein
MVSKVRHAHHPPFYLFSQSSALLHLFSLSYLFSILLCTTAAVVALRPGYYIHERQEVTLFTRAIGYFLCCS